MSRRRNCYANASIESFWGTLKNELVYHRDYQTGEEAIKDITEYIEIFYNRQRLQKWVIYLSPAALSTSLNFLLTWAQQPQWIIPGLVSRKL